MSDILCILGMHRSGTSITSGWLHKCGLELGDELLREDFSNKMGHFEDLDFLNLHKNILQSQGAAISGLEIDKKPIVSASDKTKMEDLISKKSEQNRQWGWKDPRTCLFADHYLEIAPDLKVLIVFRDYREVLRSLINRDVLRIKEALYGGRCSRWRWGMKSSNIIKRTIERNYLSYAKSMVIYFECLLNLLDKLNKDQWIPFKFTLEDKMSADLFKRLNESWNFELTYVPFKEIVDINLKSKNFVETSLIPFSTELDALQIRLEKVLKSNE